MKVQSICDAFLSVLPRIGCVFSKSGGGSAAEWINGPDRPAGGSGKIWPVLFRLAEYIVQSTGCGQCRFATAQRRRVWKSTEDGTWHTVCHALLNFRYTWPLESQRFVRIRPYPSVLVRITLLPACALRNALCQPARPHYSRISAERSLPGGIMGSTWSSYPVRISRR